MSADANDMDRGPAGVPVLEENTMKNAPAPAQLPEPSGVDRDTPRDWPEDPVQEFPHYFISYVYTVEGSMTFGDGVFNFDLAWTAKNHVSLRKALAQFLNVRNVTVLNYHAVPAE